jgi:endogenous inhibitor of DNA gyrase (YacG/DUF329 family)
MHCPICKNPVPNAPVETGRSDFPFCSERCKLIDLGRWLGGRYQIPVEPDDEDESSDPSSYPRPQEEE